MVKIISKDLQGNETEIEMEVDFPEEDFWEQELTAEINTRLAELDAQSARPLRDVETARALELEPDIEDLNKLAEISVMARELRAMKDYEGFPWTLETVPWP